MRVCAHDRVFVVLHVRPIGRADLDEGGARAAQYVRNPESAADLDELPAGDDHLRLSGTGLSGGGELGRPALHQRGEGEHHRRRVVVHRDRALRAGEAAERRLGVPVPVPPPRRPRGRTRGSCTPPPPASWPRSSHPKEELARDSCGRRRRSRSPPAGASPGRHRRAGRPGPPRSPPGRGSGPPARTSFRVRSSSSLIASMTGPCPSRATSPGPIRGLEETVGPGQLPELGERRGSGFWSGHVRKLRAVFDREDPCLRRRKQVILRPTLMPSIVASRAAAESYLWAIILFPLAGAIVNGLIGRRLGKGNVTLVAIGAMVGSFIVAAVAFSLTLQGQVLQLPGRALVPGGRAGRPRPHLGRVGARSSTGSPGR